MNRLRRVLKTTGAWVRAGRSERPFLFVIGAPRSGTTLLKTLLVAHSRIGGTDYESTGIFRLRDLTRFHVSDLDQLRTEAMFSASHDIVDFYERITQAILEKRGKQVFCDKLTIRKFRLRWVARHFPNARFVNIVRDCRDAYCSAQRHENVQQSVTIRKWTDYWIQCVETPATTIPAISLYTVRYEDLTNAPQLEVTRLMNWSNIPFEAAQIDPSHYSGTTSIKKRSVHRNLAAPISARSQQRWRNELATEDRVFVAQHAGKQLAALGYELD